MTAEQKAAEIAKLDAEIAELVNLEAEAYVAMDTNEDDSKAAALYTRWSGFHKQLGAAYTAKLILSK